MNPRCSAISRKTGLNPAYQLLGKTNARTLNVSYFVPLPPALYAQHDAMWHGTLFCVGFAYPNFIELPCIYHGIKASTPGTENIKNFHLEQKNLPAESTADYSLCGIKLLKCIQRRVTKVVKSLEGEIHKKWLRSLSLFSMLKRRLRADLIAVYNFLKESSGGGDTNLLSLVTSSRTRGNGMKGKFRLDIRKRFFTERVVGHWNWLPMEVVIAPSLSEFKEHLDDTHTHMV
ncbi:hypothetical protein llap_10326 [Limosa lapponica baueri]|uniref:Rna-directed dna polymerase from mobile element jockey-like n=1 Tax=Limosa lapponica baueri TaxID=1758121 RepID=A0A2I0TZY9_LIMLA|nr:hypothetical protein llap_10326 [Limosa lapponica baueri]